MARHTARKPRLPIIVKVAEIGGTVQEVCLNGERSILVALKAGGMEDKAIEAVKVNGEQATEDMELENGDIITISKKTSYGL
jgi:hypothetical protein